MTFAIEGWIPDVFWFVFLPTVFWIALGVLAVRWLLSRDTTPTRKGSAERILEERYARGEITRDEFVERRKVLRGR